MTSRLFACFNATVAASILALCLPSAVAAPITFAGTGAGSIPDAIANTPGTPLVISFSVNGMGAPLTDVRVTMNFSPTHTFAGDLVAVLKAPGGSPSVTLFGRIGAVTPSRSFGSGRHLTGTYTFVDPAISSVNIWTEEAAVASPTGVIPVGTYATTVTGPVTTAPASTTPLLSAFTSLNAGQVNGIWTLELRDMASGDQGGISSASLTLDSLPPPPTQFTLSPAALDFGTLRVGDAAFRAFNVVAPAANGLDIEIPAGACTISGADAGSFAKLFNAVTIPPGQRALLPVVFRSLTTGVKNATLNCTGLIPSGVTPATISVPLTGTAGTPPPPANCYDVDGDGVMNPLVDGLFITRLQLGMTLTAAANGITFSPPRNTPLKVAAFLVTSCGYSLAD